MSKELIKGRRKARKLVLQALYQWLMANSPLEDIEAQFRVFNDMSKVDVDYFCKILRGVPNQLEPLQEAIVPFLDRPIESLNPIELTVLRIGGFELLFCPEIPYKVILDEAVSLTKEFGSQDGFRFVNGVLNHLAKQVRKIEIEQER